MNKLEVHTQRWEMSIYTGLSRGFFYKNQIVRTLLDKALEQQVGMVDPRKHILDMAMGNEIERLHEKIRTLQSENRRLHEENEKLQKALAGRKAALYAACNHTIKYIALAKIMLRAEGKPHNSIKSCGFSVYEGQ